MQGSLFGDALGQENWSLHSVPGVSRNRLLGVNMGESLVPGVDGALLCLVGVTGLSIVSSLLCESHCITMDDDPG